jgi:predicted GH43/DUF377 family glycosyl hydrolase
MSNQPMELFRRHRLNPILSATDWPYPINSVFNPGATLLRDGTTLLLCRVEDRCGHSHFGVARSANGIDNWQIDRQPTLVADPDSFPEELWGIEDPRITYVPELNTYAVVYTAYTRDGPGVALALTEDFQRFERYGVIMSPAPEMRKGNETNPLKRCWRPCKRIATTLKFRHVMLLWA